MAPWIRTHLRWFTYSSFMRLAEAAGFVEAAPLLRMHYGEDQKAPRPLLEALAADAGADAANSFYDESDVRQYLITLKRRDEPPPPRPYDPAILEARLAEIDKRQTDQRGRGRRGTRRAVGEPHGPIKRSAWNFNFNCVFTRH